MKTAIVTGASSGIGRATALALARQKWGVIITYNSRSDAAKALIEEVERTGGTAAAAKLDLSKVGSFDAFAANTRANLREHFQREDFDLLVNNAGVGGGMPFGDITEAYFDAMFAANFKGPFFLTQKLTPLMIDGGHIVNVSSGSAYLAAVGYSAYGPTKAALTSVTRYWAKEFAPRKIRVNSVSPGPVLTNFADGAFTKHPEYIEPLGASTLIGRIAQPEDIGEAIAALASESCRYLTAADVDVSGGFMI
jgi:NAD(P)-dependent dehydrogenase (short-subunit alcohol dehydrogenase family)